MEKNFAVWILMFFIWILGVFNQSLAGLIILIAMGFGIIFNEYYLYKMKEENANR